MQSLYFYWLLVCSFVGTAVFGQSLDYPSFRNISLGTNANTVHSFAQDSLGMLWLGSNNGLFNYDGYALQPLTGTKSPFQTFVYCIALIDNKHFALGTGQGVLLYNYEFDRFESFPTGGPGDVRSLLLVGETLWIGSISGLYCYNTKTRKLIDYHNSFPKNKSKAAVYALEKVGDRILIGTYNGLFELNPSKKDIVPLPLPDYRPGSNQFVNSIFSIPESASTYVGTEYGLYRYNTKNHTLQKTRVLQNHPIKAMASKDSNTLLVGTDDGLFTYQLDQQLVKRIKHDSRNRNSLANNIVWSIFKDRSENIWLGTDLGFSLGLSPAGYSSWTAGPLYILFCLRKQRRERPSLKNQ